MRKRNYTSKRILPVLLCLVILMSVLLCAPVTFQAQEVSYAPIKDAVSIGDTDREESKHKITNEKKQTELCELSATDNIVSEDTVFVKDGVKYSFRDKSYIHNKVNYVLYAIGYEESIVKDLVIPATVEGYDVEGVYLAAFSDCKTLESVVVSDGIRYIGSSAFEGCSSLKSVYLPDSIEEMWHGVFEYCTSLKEVRLPRTSSQRVYLGFGHCTSLESVVIPKEYISIVPEAFEYCTSLKSVTFEKGSALKRISSSTFLNCTSLEKLNFPDSLELIAEEAFKNCTGLKSVVFPSSKKTVVLSDYVFYGCESLETVVLPKLVDLYAGTFEDCYSLTDVTIQDGLEMIARRTFFNCYSLSQLYIPKSVEYIGEMAFGCFEEDGVYYSMRNFTVCGYPESLAKDYADAYGMKYALPAPKLSSVKNTTDGVKISFKKLSGVSGKYRVYRKTSGSSWKKLADVTGTSYVDKTAVSGKKYTYTVKYIGKPANSVYDKNGLSIVRLSTPSVSKITNVNEGAKLSIKGVDGASKYTVFVKSGSSWKKLGDTTTTTFVHENLNSGTTYTYTVKSYDASLVYASAYNSTGFKNKFVAPPVISKLSNTESGVKITWGKVSGAEKYRVFVKSGSKWKKLTDTTSTSFTHTSAQSGKTYTYTVRCISESGKSYKSGYDTKGTSTMFLATPKVKKISNTVDGAKITWGEVDGAYKYNIYVKSGSSWKKLGESNTTSFVHETAKSGTSYSYRVRAYDETTEFSSYYKTSNKNTFIGAPVISSLTSTNSGVKIAWGKVNGAAKYRVFVKSGSSWKKLKDTTSTSFVHKNVQSGSSYTYTVRCISESGKSYTSGYDTTGQTIIFE